MDLSSGQWDEILGGIAIVIVSLGLLMLLRGVRSMNDDPE
jgi:hypothetical protein